MRRSDAGGCGKVTEGTGHTRRDLRPCWSAKGSRQRGGGAKRSTRRLILGAGIDGKAKISREGRVLDTGD